MRTLALATCIVLLAPRAVSACQPPFHCDVGSPRIEAFTLHTVSPVPRDGAVVIRTDRDHGEACLDVLAPHLTLGVTRDGTPVPGEVVQYRGLPDVLIWRPADLLAANAEYTITITADNDALEPPGTVDEICGEPLVVGDFVVTTGDALLTAPPPAAPEFSEEKYTHAVRSSLACCPGVFVDYNYGDCEDESLYWEPGGGCGYIHGYIGIGIHADRPDLPPELAGQYIHQLVVDGDIEVRRLGDGGSLASESADPVCARAERIHLGTGEVVASAESCPPPDLAAKIGHVPYTPILPCADPEICNGAGGCTPYDPANPPPPPDWTPYPDPFYFYCDDATAMVDSEPAGPTPTSSAETGSDASGSSDDTGPPADDPAGCTCTSTTRPGGPLALLLALLARRRRTPPPNRLPHPARHETGNILSGCVASPSSR